MAKKPRNKFEKRLYDELKANKIKFGYETEKLPYVIHGTYIPDIYVQKKKLYIEAKGYFRPEAMRKMVAVKTMHPELDIRIVFYSLNKKYIKWAEKYGFPYAIGTIPLEWLK